MSVQMLEWFVESKNYDLHAIEEIGWIYDLEKGEKDLKHVWAINRPF